eukprot:15445-Heterococcus_DN1.PRE.4
MIDRNTGTDAAREAAVLAQMILGAQEIMLLTGASGNSTCCSRVLMHCERKCDCCYAMRNRHGDPVDAAGCVTLASTLRNVFTASMCHSDSTTHSYSTCYKRSDHNEHTRLQWSWEHTTSKAS